MGSHEERKRLTYPLLNKWYLWYYNKEAGKAWIDCNQRILSFNTAEHFWDVYEETKSPSLLSSGQDYAVFKDNIVPMWEDERNECGGRWILEIPRYHRFRFLNKLWLRILVLMTGESFLEHGNDICGAVLNRRKTRDRISMWTCDSSKIVGINAIGNLLQDSFKKVYPEMGQMTYVPHRDTIDKCPSKDRIELSLRHDSYNLD